MGCGAAKLYRSTRQRPKEITQTDGDAAHRYTLCLRIENNFSVPIPFNLTCPKPLAIPIPEPVSFEF